MIYREQDPSAATARINELEREVARLRKKRGEAVANAAPLVVLMVMIAVAISGALLGLRGCARDEAECDVACAAQNGLCHESSESGFACVRRPYSSQAEYYAVSRGGE